MKGGLAIRDVAERTGLAAGTIRMWEQRYGAPVPSRAPSGYRVYSQEDVELLRRAVAFRERGRQPRALQRVARADLDLGGEPRARGVADECTDAPAAAQQLVEQV